MLTLAFISIYGKKKLADQGHLTGNGRKNFSKNIIQKTLFFTILEIF